MIYEIKYQSKKLRNMKLQIRKGVFETNSSSTHAISIRNNSVGNNYPEEVSFELGTFGWEYDHYNDTHTKASYLWTAIVCLAKEGGNIEGDINYSVDDFVKYITETLSQYNIIAKFPHNYKTMKSYGGEEHMYNIFHDKDGNKPKYWIDHCDLSEFLNAMMSHQDLLMSYLFDDDSILITGNDNDDYDVEDEITKNGNTIFYKGN